MMVVLIGNDMTSAPLIHTKLAAPRLRADLLPRADLMQRLQATRQRKLLLISGPAGCGKSSLAAAWRLELMRQGSDVAWLTLNRDDDDFGQIVPYLAKTLDECGISGEALEIFRRDRDDDSGEAFTVALINSLSRHERDLHLVLDDFQHISNPKVLRLVERLLEFAPANFHLCLITRKRIPFSLAKLRLRDEITQIDVADLHFSVDETARYLEARLGPLSPGKVREVYALTDGWAAALVLVALTLGRHAGAEPALSLRPANLRNFNEILDSEVLAELAADEIALLTQAAACRLFNGALCASLSGHPRADAVLSRLYDENLFLVEIDGGDDPLRWYRFHPLLRQRLLANFLRLSQAQRLEVNRKACAWFDAQGLQDEALRHALYANDVERAVDLTEACARDLIQTGMSLRLIKRVARLPEQATQGRLRLQLALCWAQLYCHRIRDAQETCQRIAAITAAADLTSQYESHLQRASLAVVHDDSDAAFQALQDAAAIADAAEPFLMGMRETLLTWALAFRGDHEGAQQAYRAARLAMSGAPASVRQTVGECFYATSLSMQGDTPGALRVLRKSFETASALAGPYAAPACQVAGYLGEVLFETGQVDEVITLVGERLDLIARMSTDVALRGLLALARAQRARGERGLAQETMARLEEIGQLSRNQRLVASFLGEQVSWRLADGDRDGAAEALRKLVGVAQPCALEPQSVGSEIALLAAFARIEFDLAEGASRQTLERIDALLAKCKTWRRLPLVAKLAIQRAQACLDLQDRPGANAALRMALQLGQPRGWVGSFVDCSAKVSDLMRDMLAADTEDAGLKSYLDTLLGAGTRVGEAPVMSPVGKPNLTQSLTDREVEITQLLARALSNKKIAKALQISDQTVKWHLKNIYGKLGVVSRGEVVARCRELGMLD